MMILNDKSFCKQSKAKIRKNAKEKRNIIEDKKSKDEQICSNLINLPLYKNAKTIFAYSPIGSEINLTLVFDDVFQNGKTLCLPRCFEQGLMEFFPVNDFDDLSPGPFGIMQPNLSLPAAVPNEDTCVIVPALVYDFFGNRIGYGGGFYDRYLAKYEIKNTVGLCYDESLFENHLPIEQKDVAVSCIITPTKTLEVNHG